ncbi:MAG TPA: hypothetical protein VHI71_01005 [Actinomycetota bacterium]|nr:hypothetical protein [Actinomycetota bacterium]
MDGLLRLMVTPLPSPSATFVFDPPPADPVQAVGAVVAIALALAAAILGYRIIRGGRGL